MNYDIRTTTGEYGDRPLFELYTFLTLSDVFTVAHFIDTLLFWIIPLTSHTSVDLAMIQSSEKPSASPSAAAGASTEPGKPYVRLARPEDYPQIEKVARRAYIADPMPMYLGAISSVSQNFTAFNPARLSSSCPHSHLTDYSLCVYSLISQPITPEDRKADDVESLFHFLIGIGRCFGGRTTVVAIPTSNPSDGTASLEKIAAVCLWMPPRCRANPWSTVKLFKSGIWRPLKAWGPRVIKVRKLFLLHGGGYRC